MFAWVIFCNVNNACSEPLSLDQVLQASCRITSYGGTTGVFGNASIDYGSGLVISEDQDEFFIITNGHVIANQSNIIYAEFFHNGHKSSPVKATIKWVRFSKNTSIDAALLSVPKSYFGKIKPVVIPLADKGITLTPGDYVYGAGCPKGYWNQVWEGRVVRNTENVTYINAPPCEGQSGSAMLADLLDDKGDVNTRVVGIITWRIGENNAKNIEGGALSLKRIHELLTGHPSPDRITASFSYPAGHVENEPCEACGHNLADHLIVPDGKGGLIKNKDGEVRMFCPNSASAQKYGIKTGTFIDASCPPGGCIYLPWMPPRQNQFNYPPAQPAPISPDGIWNLPDKDIKGGSNKPEPEIAPPPPEENPVPVPKPDDKQDELNKQIVDLIAKLANSDDKNKSLEKTILDITNDLAESNKAKDFLSKEQTDLLSTISDLNKSLGLSEKLLGDKSAEYTNLLDKFINTSENNEKLAKENVELGYNNNVRNVSFTLAGAGTTAGLWFLKSYLLPAVIGGFKRRKQGGTKDVKPDEINYGEVPDAVLNNPNDNSTDQKVVNRKPPSNEPQYQLPPNQLPPGQFVSEMYKNLQSQLPAWNNYATYSQQVSPMITGLNPGAPYAAPFPKKQPTPEQMMTALSEIANEYASDYTMTAGHTLTLLKQRLKTKYGIDY